MLKITILAALSVLLVSNRTHAGEKSLYDFLWLDPDKKVYVLQNKLYKKEHTFYADVGYISNFTSKFQDTQGFNLKAGYYFHEEWGLEVFYNQYSNGNNEDWRNVRSINGADPFVRRFNQAYGAFAIWSPFYGKINTFNRIFYFDWSFGLGYSQISAESNRDTVSDTNLRSSYKDESYNAVAWKTNLKFHLSENVHLGVEWMQQHYRAKGPDRNGQKASESFKVNQDLILSIGFSY
jgi:outer membrane beta-barrel protein